MNVPRHLTFIVASLFLPLLSFAQQTGIPTEVDRRLSLYAAELAVAYESVVQRHFKEKVRNLDLSYFQALERAMETASKAARLEEAIAIREERKHLEETSGVPPSDAPDDPPALVQLRATYRTQLQKLEAERDLAAAPVLAEHDAKLEAYQTLLTTDGKLDEALKVKEARGEAHGRLAGNGSGDAHAKTEEDGTGWHLVFDGNRLDYWKAKGSSRNFPLSEGILAAKQATDSADYLFFKGSPMVPEILKNFELKAKVRADAEANSGIYFHIGGKGEGRGGHPESGIEVNLQKGPQPARYPTGSLYDVASRSEANIDQSNWFELHFKVVDRIVTVFLNGEPYLERLVDAAPDPDSKGIQPKGGLLAIQANSKSGAYHFESISIKPLD